MIACAAAAPPLRASWPAAAVMPALTFFMSSFTPMTPVDATNTAAGSQPTALAAARVMAFACSRPSGPVQALAQPLFTTIADSRPCERSR